MGDRLGYARVSTADQDVAGQAMRLEQAGVIKLFTDVRSGRSMDRPGLEALLAYARKGDTLTVVRLDREADEVCGLQGRLGPECPDVDDGALGSPGAWCLAVVHRFPPR